ncbi:MAG: N-acetyltransferase family protein, partial [Methanomassiliicoccales archaeon]
AAGIAAIRNHYILCSDCTMQTVPVSAEEERAWLEAHGAAFPVLVAELGEGLVGYASLSSYRPRPAYDRTVEDSVYVREDLQGRGIGTALLTELIAAGSEHGFHSMVGIIGARQEASLRLHHRHGFKDVGTLREVGFKFGHYLDISFLQLILE